MEEPGSLSSGVFSPVGWCESEADNSKKPWEMVQRNIKIPKKTAQKHETLIGNDHQLKDLVADFAVANGFWSSDDTRCSSRRAHPDQAVGPILNDYICFSILGYGGFHEWGYPQSSSIDGIFPKPTIYWGAPPFMVNHALTHISIIINHMFNHKWTHVAWNTDSRSGRGLGPATSRHPSPESRTSAGPKRRGIPGWSMLKWGASRW